MRQQSLYYRCAVTMSVLGMLTGQLAQAAGPQIAAEADRAVHTQAGDIGLGDGGVLRGQLLRADGSAVSGATILLLKNGETVAATQTTAGGEFQAAGLAGGLYEVQTPMGRGIYRLWAPRTAPPSAQEGVLIVDGQDIRRGQAPQNGMLTAIGSALANPWVLAIIVGAAIAIPLALDDDDAS